MATQLAGGIDPIGTNHVGVEEERRAIDREPGEATQAKRHEAAAVAVDPDDVVNASNVRALAIGALHDVHPGIVVANRANQDAWQCHIRPDVKKRHSQHRSPLHVR